MEDDSLLYHVEKHGDKIKKIMKEKLFFSNRLIRKMEEEENIYLNGKKAPIDKNTYIDDVLKIEFRDEENIYEAVQMDLDIIFEDRDFLAVNKPPYILIHPSKIERKDTLANGIVWYYKKNNIKRKIRFINRLDMNTSGVVLIAKNSYAQSRVNDQMNKDRVVKKYTALVEGCIENKKGVIDKPIGLAEGESIKRSILEEGKESITLYNVLKEYKNQMSLVELELKTGRTHQIRVHMKDLGHPVVGDELYGKKSEFIDRQALHCSEMIIEGIRNDKKIHVKAPYPEDFLKVMEVNR